MFKVNKQGKQFFNKITSALLTLAFSLNFLITPGLVHAQGVSFLPPVGTMVSLTPAYIPLIVRGVTVDPANSLRFNFIVDTGNTGINIKEKAFKEESEKLIKYFLAAITLPESDLWVNLSPYEKDKIIPQEFGTTEMGRDMLAQDYILKQLASSLMYPEGETGKKFWDRVYKKAQEKFGTTLIPVNTFNKVWIVPDKAEVLQTGNTALVVHSRMKVMLEEDYLALKNNLNQKAGDTAAVGEKDKEMNAISSQVVREVFIPELEREVNEGKNFAQLRQIYNSLILAVWYKKNLQNTILGQVYANQKKLKGVDVEDKEVKQKIYDQYVEAFKKGVFNYIQQDFDPLKNKIVGRKYFSGGMAFGEVPETVVVKTTPAAVSPEGHQLMGDLAGAASDVDNKDTGREILKIGTTIVENSQNKQELKAISAGDLLVGVIKFTYARLLEIALMKDEEISQLSSIEKNSYFRIVHDAQQTGKSIWDILIQVRGDEGNFNEVLEAKTKEVEWMWEMQKRRGRFIERSYTAKSVAFARLTVRNDFKSQNETAQRAREDLFAARQTKKAINTFGPFDEMMLESMWRNLMKGIYIGGYAESARDGGPDKAVYAWKRVAETTQRFSNFLQEYLRNHPELQNIKLPWFMVDIDTGHLNPRGMVEFFMTTGPNPTLIAILHIEDQAHGVKECGHGGEKAVVSEDEMAARLSDVLFVLDVMGLETMLNARTDTEGATLITSDESRNDQRHILGVTNPDVIAYADLMKRKISRDREGQMLTNVTASWKKEAGLMTMGQAVHQAMEQAMEKGRAFAMSLEEWDEFVKTASFRSMEKKAKELGIDIYTVQDYRRNQQRGTLPQDRINIVWDYNHGKIQDKGYTFWWYKGSLEAASTRSAALVMKADMHWLEQKKPNKQEIVIWSKAINAAALLWVKSNLVSRYAKKFVKQIQGQKIKAAEGILQQYLDRSLDLEASERALAKLGFNADEIFAMIRAVTLFKANNISPNFAWLEVKPDGSVMLNPELENFLDEQADEGDIQFHFSTFFGMVVNSANADRFVKDFEKYGARALAEFQAQAIEDNNALARGPHHFTGGDAVANRDRVARGRGFRTPEAETGSNTMGGFRKLLTPAKANLVDSLDDREKVRRVLRKVIFNMFDSDETLNKQLAIEAIVGLLGESQRSYATAIVTKAIFSNKGFPATLLGELISQIDEQVAMAKKLLGETDVKMDSLLDVIIGLHASLDNLRAEMEAEKNRQATTSQGDLKEKIDQELEILKLQVSKVEGLLTEAIDTISRLEGSDQILITLNEISLKNMDYRFSNPLEAYGKGSEKQGIQRDLFILQAGLRQVENAIQSMQTDRGKESLISKRAKIQALIGLATAHLDPLINKLADLVVVKVKEGETLRPLLLGSVAEEQDVILRDTEGDFIPRALYQEQSLVNQSYGDTYKAVSGKDYPIVSYTKLSRLVDVKIKSLTIPTSSGQEGNGETQTLNSINPFYLLAGLAIAALTIRRDKKLGDLAQAYPDVYNPKALDVLGRFASRTEDIHALLDDEAAREIERKKRKEDPKFLPTTNPDGSDYVVPRMKVSVKQARRGDFEGAPVPKEFLRPGITLTGPTTRHGQPLEKSLRSIAYQLLSGAEYVLLDGEDSLGQLDTMSIDGIRNIILAYKKDPIFMKVAEQVASEMIAKGKRPADWNWRKLIDENYTTRIYRVRGLHLDDRHVTYTTKAGKEIPISAAIVDLILYVTNTYETLLDQDSPIAIYFPKLQSAEEAALFAEILDDLEATLEYKGRKLNEIPLEDGKPGGIIKVLPLIENVQAAMQAMEIRAAFGRHIVELNMARWDYIATVIKAKDHDSNWIPDDFKVITMTYPFMAVAEDTLWRAVNTPDKNGLTILGEGGMEVQIPTIPDDIPQAEKDTYIAAFMAKAKANKEREAKRFSRAWVAHPDMVDIVAEPFKRVYGSGLHPILNQKADAEGIAWRPLTYTDKDAQAFFKLADKPTRTVQGVREDISVYMQYKNNVLTGQGAASIKPADFFLDPSVPYLMEDRATDEGRGAGTRKKVRWQATFTEDDPIAGIKAGDHLTSQLLERLIEEEFTKLYNAPDRIVYNSSKETTLKIARGAFERFTLTGDVDIPWSVDLEGVVLGVDDPQKAAVLMDQYINRLRTSDGVSRMTENPQFLNSLNPLSVLLAAGRTLAAAVNFKRIPVIGYNMKGELLSGDVDAFLEGIADDYNDTRKKTINPNRVGVIAIFAEGDLKQARAKIDELVEFGRIPKGFIKLGAQNVRVQPRGAPTRPMLHRSSNSKIGVLKWCF